MLEGIDKAGKTTQAHRLVETLEFGNIVARVLSFPNRTTPTGHQIDQYLKGELFLSDEDAHRLFAANRWEMESTISKLLEDGVTLIVDRYVYSGICYAAQGKTSTTFDLSFESLKALEAGLPAPDLVVFLDIAPVEAQKREGFGKERYDDLLFQTRVRDNFFKFLGDPNNVHRLCLVDVNGKSPPMIEHEILKEVHELIKETDTRLLPVRRLWGTEGGTSSFPS